MKRIFLQDLKLKALALIFAVALWFFVAGQSSTEVGFLIPVGLKGTPRGMVMVSVPPDEIEVRVMGPKFVINNLSPSQIQVGLDMSGAREGLNNLRIVPGDIAVPMGVEVVKTRPVSVDIRLERLITVNLPIKVRLTGRPASGYKVIDVNVSPRSVAATGVRKEMRDLSGVYTKPVDVSGLTSSALFTVQLDMPAKEFRSVSYDKVDVKVVIGKGK
ncbi:MAG: YbbR-like domain-containing protein [Deltaproteobacteria bacterium]|nr:YbbR-like domain-containing protein [Deltaproteobacteria bacterium]